MKQLTIPAKIYIGAVIFCGTSLLLLAYLHWHSDSTALFAAMLLFAVVLARWKVTLPGVNGTMSVVSVIALLSVAELGQAEAMTVVCAAGLCQCLVSVKRRTTVVNAWFNVAMMAGATWATYESYHLGLFARLHVAHAVILLLVSGVYFVFNTVPVAGVLALTEHRPFREVWCSFYLWSLPFYLLSSVIATVTGTAARMLGWQSCLAIVPVVYVIYRSFHLYIGRMEEEKRHATEISDLHLRTIEALALAIEAKDQTTASHLQRVQIYALAIGKELGMGPQDLEALRAASLLHDIGKLAVPEYIVSKPGKLTREEFEKMKIHPVVGAEILEHVHFPYPVSPIVRSHHEKWNGEGYPDGLRGEEIPLGARILAAVDCLDALASDRQYRKAFPLNEAMDKVVEEAGKSFDPQVVEVLQRRYQDLERAARQPERNNQMPALSVDVKVERGEAPAAGLESTGAAPVLQLARKASFVESIAAARQEVQDLFELTHDLGRQLSVQDALSVFAARIKKLLPHDCVAIYLLDGDLLRPKFVAGENFRYFSSLEIPLGSGLSGWVAENVKAIINGNPSVEAGEKNRMITTTLRSALSVPLEAGNRVIGVLSLYLAEPDGFTQENLRILLSIAPKLAQTVENTARYETAENSAALDFITALPNARSLFTYLESEIARCTAEQIPLAILLGDLDGFKRVNDTLGHLAGNDALRRAAGALRSCCRPVDFLARMGGDEFVLLLPGLSPEAMQSRLEVFEAALTQATSERFRETPISISFGSAVLGEDGTDPDTLIAAADRRMYNSKRRRKTGRCEPAVQVPA